MWAELVAVTVAGHAGRTGELNKGADPAGVDCAQVRVGPAAVHPGPAEVKVLSGGTW
jgi:hypothetical protein